MVLTSAVDGLMQRRNRARRSDRDGRRPRPSLIRTLTRSRIVDLRRAASGAGSGAAGVRDPEQTRRDREHRRAVRPRGPGGAEEVLTPQPARRSVAADQTSEAQSPVGPQVARSDGCGNPGKSRAWCASTSRAADEPVPGDAVTWLSCYVVLLLFVPSRLVVGPLGSAGAPSMLFGLGSLLLWLFLPRRGTARPPASGGTPIRIALVLPVLRRGQLRARDVSSD